MSMLANPNYYQAYYERQRYPKHTDGSYYTVEELDPSLKKFSKQYKYSSSCYSISKDTAALNANPSSVEKDLSTSSASSTSGKSEKVPIKSEFPALNKEEDEDLEEDEETEAPKQKKQEEPKSTPHGRAYPKTYYRPRQAGVHSDPILSYHILPKDSFARPQPSLSQVQSTSPKTTLNPEQSPSSMRSLSNSYTPHFLPTPISSKPLYPSFMVPSAPLPLFEGVYAYDPASLNPSVQQDRRFLPPSYAVPVTLPTQQAFVSDSVLSDPLSKKFGANEKGAPAAYPAYIYPQVNSMAPYFAYYPQQFSKTSNPSCPPLYPTSPSPELLSFYSTPLAKGRTPVSNLSPSPYNVVDVIQKKSSYFFLKFRCHWLERVLPIRWRKRPRTLWSIQISTRPPSRKEFKFMWFRKGSSSSPSLLPARQRIATQSPLREMVMILLLFSLSNERMTKTRLRLCISPTRLIYDAQ